MKHRTGERVDYVVTYLEMTERPTFPHPHLPAGPAAALIAATVTASNAGDQHYQLASAHEVVSTSGPPVLKIAANGPIAFALEPPTDEPAAGVVVVRRDGEFIFAGGQVRQLEGRSQESGFQRRDMHDRPASSFMTSVSSSVRTS